MGRMIGGMEFPRASIAPVPPAPSQAPASRLWIRLADRPDVQVGQQVQAGQALLGESEREPISSPIEGVIRQVIAPGEGTRSRGYDVVIDPSSETVSTALDAAPPPVRGLQHWIEGARQFGPWPGRDGEVGLLPQLAVATRTPVRALICLALDRSPMLPDASSLLASYGEAVVKGAALLAELLQARRAYLICDRDHPTRGDVRAECRHFDIRMITAANRYPLGHTTLACRHLAPERFQIPAGANPADHGVVVVAPWTAIRLWRWQSRGQVDLIRPVFMGWCGPQPRLTCAWGMTGQPLASLEPDLTEGLDAPDAMLIDGDPLQGRLIVGDSGLDPDRPLALGARTTLLTRMTAAAPRQASPCIACGLCVEVCPTRLLPAAMHRLASEGHHAAPLLNDLDWCVNCGLCSHVCPSHIPLAQTFHDLRIQRATDAPVDYVPAEAHA